MQALREAEIASKEEIERARIASERGLDEARIGHETLRRQLEVEREKAVETAQMEKAIALYQKSPRGERRPRPRPRRPAPRAAEAEERVNTAKRDRGGEPPQVASTC